MKRGKGILWAACLVILGCAGEDGGLAVDSRGRTVAERYGQLRTEGTMLLNAAGKPVQLRGISSFGLQYAGKYANEEVIRWLRDDWNMQVWRAALYTSEGGYIRQPALKSKVTDSVEAAIKLGLYVLVDWHILMDGDPRLYQKQAVAFFGEMAQRYGEYPNVLYEICNEPNGEEVTWRGAVKPYA
ncbi:MAG: glycoside hydrolase family 5 protein, partial [Treponema sp.]|nr:glycoside hydrolase family 5 protein [Treponema sp.]